MKHCFVLDENIIILAQKLENVSGQRDATCLNLLRSIEQNCHGIALFNSCWGTYSRQLRTLVHQYTETRVMVILATIVRNIDKNTRFVADDSLTVIPGLEHTPGVEEGDRPFVRVGASVQGAILVTEDGPLTSALEQRGIAGRFGFAVRSSSDALVIAASEY